MKPKTTCILAMALSALIFLSVSVGKEPQNSRAILRGVSFKSGSAVLLQPSIKPLEALLGELHEEPSLKLIIEGFTDSTGSHQNNVELSRRRAQAVADWLVEHGIEPARLEVQGLGGLRPIADNSTPQGRTLNRRIEIVKVKGEVPAAVLPARSYEFKPVLEGDEVRHDFIIQNKGTAPLFISRVKTG